MIIISQINNIKTCSSCGAVNQYSNRFCIECGIEFSLMEAPKFEIVENLKTSLYGSVICIAMFVAFMVLVTIIIPIQVGLYGLIAIPIIWPITICFLYWAKSYLSGLSQFRRFTISDKFIEIVVPDKPQFHINWNDFDSIEVWKKESTAVIPTGDTAIIGPRFIYFTLIFKGSNSQQTYEFESGKDFKYKSRKKILAALEQHAQEKSKTYIGWRWRDKRKAKKESKS